MLADFVHWLQAFLLIPNMPFVLVLVLGQGHRGVNDHVSSTILCMVSEVSHFALQCGYVAGRSAQTCTTIFTTMHKSQLTWTNAPPTVVFN